MRLLNGRIQFRTAAVLTVLLPLSSFIVCVLWSLYFNFTSATATHCGVNSLNDILGSLWLLILHFMQVPNYLPSVSAAIGDYFPQKYIWRVAIALHTIPRIRIAFVYFVYYISILAKHTGSLVRLNCALNLIEIFSYALLYLTAKCSE